MTMNSAAPRSECCARGTGLNAPPWGTSIVTRFSFVDEEPRPRESEDLPQVIQLASGSQRSGLLLKTGELRGLIGELGVHEAGKPEGGAIWRGDGSALRGPGVSPCTVGPVPLSPGPLETNGMEHSWPHVYFTSFL